MISPIWIVVSLWMAGAALPDGLEQLQGLEGNQTALIDAMRAFDLRESALAEAGLSAAEEGDKPEDKEAAAAKHREAMERFTRIRAGYEYVLRLYPSDAKAQTYYGELLYDRFGEIPGALRAWELAMSQDPKLSTPVNDMAIHCCHTGDYLRGLQYYDRAIALNPNMADYRYNLAQAYLTNVRDVQKYRKWKKPRIYREAMKLSKRAKELAPDDFSIVQDYAVNFFAGEHFGVTVKWKDAAKAWQDARPLAHSPEQCFYTWLNEARVWIHVGDKARAAQCLDEALALRPGSEVAKNLRAQLGQAAPAPTPAPASNPTPSK